MTEHDDRLPKSSHSSASVDTIASKANALEVYEDAVQEPLLECTNLASMYYGAQEIGSRRPDAKVLREDFCSSAIVAQTWLGLERGNRSQGVDIDLEALRVAQRRTAKSKRKVQLIQSSQYSSTGHVQVLPLGKEDLGEAMGEISTDSSVVDEASTSTSASASTWSQGAASDRFERRFQAKMAKEKLAKANKKSDGQTEVEEAMTLIHADVLSLPVAGMEVEAPDLVYAGNYALSYFHDRKSLLEYLRQCRRTLRPETGVLIVDPFAGPTNWEPSNKQERQEQEKLWSQFKKEPGFLRDDTGSDPPPSLGNDDLAFWTSSLQPTNGSDWKGWPRGRLILVRKGHLCGGYEYWREDGPLDYVTNQFRMSLSFRFKDGSWLRDYFSYDFRVWSLREITEAMQEVGFERVQVHAIPRTTTSSQEERKESEQYSNGRRNSDSSIDTDGSSDDGDANNDDGQDGLGGMANLIKRTEKQETEKASYKHLDKDQKLFAAKSFGTYIIACMPSNS